MADTDAPTQEQINEANKAEEAKWQDDFDQENLTIPYKAEEKTKDKDESGAGNNESENNDNDDNSSEEVYSEPDPIVTIDDPGEYTPADYSFEVILKDGKSVKISSPEEADKIADDPDNFETPKQLSDFLKKSLSMSNKLERDKEKFDEQKAKFTEQTKLENERMETIANISNEFEYLANNGLLPKVDPKYINADWSDPEVAKQPGVKEQIELLNYMVKENEKRAKNNIKPFTSALDAFNAFTLDKDRKAQAKELKEAGQARRNAGAKVSGVSAGDGVPYVPKGIAVGNPRKLDRSVSIWDN